MASLKTMLRRPRVQAILSATAAGYIRLVYATSRWQRHGLEIAAPYIQSGQPIIAAFWHGRLLMMACFRPKEVPLAMLQSPHPDGRLIAQTINRLGVETIYGSSSHGGAAAMRTIVKALRAGKSIGFTPEGPRGPCMRATVGVIHAARLSGVPILPVSYAVRRRRVLNSWDRFILALPFTRGVHIFGEPISVPQDASDEAIEAARQLLEDRLNAITAEADRLVGVDPIAPAPRAASTPKGKTPRGNGARNDNGAARDSAGAGAPRVTVGKP